MCQCSWLNWCRFPRLTIQTFWVNKRRVILVRLNKIAGCAIPLCWPVCIRFCSDVVRGTFPRLVLRTVPPTWNYIKQGLSVISHCLNLLHTLMASGMNVMLQCIDTHLLLVLWKCFILIACKCSSAQCCLHYESVRYWCNWAILQLSALVYQP